MSPRDASLASPAGCAGDGEVNDFGAVRSLLRDPDGLDREVLVAKWAFQPVSLEDNRSRPDVSRHGVSVVPRCRRREIPREANELSLDAGHGRHGS
jgi:hypothetical protein